MPVYTQTDLQPLPDRVDTGLDTTVLTAAALAAAGGSMALLGWWLHLDILTRLSPNLTSMKPNTAIAAVTGGLALWLSRRRHVPASRPLALACAAILAGIGVVALLKHAMGDEFAFDELLIRWAFTIDPGVPIRNSMASSIMILLVAVSTALLEFGRWRAAQAAAAAVFGLSGLALIGTAYGVIGLYAVPGLTAVGLLTSVSFSAIGLGLLLTITERGGYEIVRSMRPGPVLARQLWLPNALVIIAIGAIVEKAQVRGLLGARADSAVFAVAVIGLTSTLFWTTGRRLNRLDDGLRETTRLYQCLSECTQVIVHSQDVDELLPHVCRTLVTTGHFAQAWIATVAPDGTVAAPATFGPSSGAPDALSAAARSSTAVSGVFDDLPVLATPAIIDGHHVGVVAVQLARRRDVLASERRLIEQVGETLASGVQRLAAEAKVRASEARFAGILSSAMDAIVSIDREQRIVIFNGAAERMFGYRYDEVAGLPLDRLLPERLRAAHRDEVVAFGRSQAMHRSIDGRPQLLGLRADGIEFPIEASISQVGTGPEMIYTAIIRDVTEQRRSAEQIRRFASTLELRVAERTSQLEAANRELEAFSYSVSHDLRAPLRSMDGFALAVIEDYGPQLPPEGLHFLNRIRQGARRLGTLVDDLLALSRLGRQSLVRGDVDMERMVRECLAELTPGQGAPEARIDGAADGPGRCRRGPGAPGVDQPARQRAEVLAARGADRASRSAAYSRDGSRCGSFVTTVWDSR